MSRVVYFVQDVETGFIKIGYSGNLDARLRALKVMAGNPLDVIFTHPGGFALERRIHGFLALHRRDGEWFEPHPDVFALIEKLKAGEDFDIVERQAVARTNAREGERDEWFRATFSAAIVAAYGQEPGWAQRAANDAGVSVECVKGWVKKRTLPNGSSLINFGRVSDPVRQWFRLSVAATFMSDRLDITETQATELIAKCPRILDIIMTSEDYDLAEIEVRSVIAEFAA